MSDIDNMNTEQVDKIMDRFDSFEARFKRIEDNMVTKNDLHQTIFTSVMTVQGFTAAIIVGVVVVLNSLVGFAG